MVLKGVFRAGKSAARRVAGMVGDNADRVAREGVEEAIETAVERAGRNVDEVAETAAERAGRSVDLEYNGSVRTSDSAGAAVGDSLATSGTECSSGFVDNMTPSEAKRYTNYWERHAPEQGEPYSIYRRYSEGTGDIKQVTTYDRFGSRYRQYDLIDSRGRQPHAHEFSYGHGGIDSRGNPVYYPRPRGVRSHDHISLNDIDW